MSESMPVNIAEDFKIGNTHIKIATDYCAHATPEDVQRILERASEIASQYLAE